MKTPKNLHDEAMRLAHKAVMARARGDVKLFYEHTRKAFLLEAEAANMLLERKDAEPTRSILFRSAAALALECGAFAAAERLSLAGLDGRPEPDVAVEFKVFLEEIEFLRNSRSTIDINAYKIPSGVFLSAEVVELWDFPDYPLLNLLRDGAGTFYLSYLATFHDDGKEERHVIAVSAGRLKYVRSGEMKIKYAYDNPENGNVIVVYLDENTEETLEQFMLPFSVYRALNPIAEDYAVFVATDETDKLDDSLRPTGTDA